MTCRPVQPGADRFAPRIAGSFDSKIIAPSPDVPPVSGQPRIDDLTLRGFDVVVYASNRDIRIERIENCIARSPVVIARLLNATDIDEVRFVWREFDSHLLEFNHPSVQRETLGR